MPELPEVETVRRGLAPVMEGAVFETVLLQRADLRFPFPPGFVARLEGARVEELARRGKYLLAALSSGETLIMHLGMSGRFAIEGARPGRFHQAIAHHAAHDHVVFDLVRPGGARARVTYNDVRRFGFMDLARTAERERCRHFQGMGPEPLGGEFTDAYFRARLKGRRTPVKAALLDQRVVAGVGNIYACEALYRAGVSPRRLAASVAGLRSDRLRAALVETLHEAIEAGGSTLRDFAASDGALGYFQHGFRVYDRAGDPCGRCGADVRRIAQAGRSTFYCGRCQR